MRRIFRSIAWVENTVLFMLIGLLYYLSIGLDSQKNLYLKSDSVGGIISQLHQKNYDVGPLDRWLLSLGDKPISGWVYIGKTHIHRLDFLARLSSKRSHFVPVTLIPGETTTFFLDQLAKKLDMNRSKLGDDYRRLSPFPEAGILADTYHIPMHLREKGTIRLLTHLSLKRYRYLARQNLGDWDPKAWERILIIASIIQKEAANTAEMPKIASVIYNRLNRHMRLQMDGTLNYGRYSHTRITPERIRNDHSTFNTYKHKGLPDLPVCNVSLPAIQAALHPAKTPYLYFMKNDRGTHDFSRTYKGHLKHVKERKKELGIRNEE